MTTSTTTLHNLNGKLAGWVPSDLVRRNMQICLAALLGQRQELNVRHDTFAATKFIDDSMAAQFQGRCSCGAEGTWSWSVVTVADWRDQHETNVRSADAR